MKAKIKSILKSEEEVHIFEGFGIKNKNKIVYFDNNIKTTLVIDDVISLKREFDYIISLNFKYLKKIDSYYNTKYGKIFFKTYTKRIVNNDKRLEIYYELLNNDEKIQDFEFILEYTIDT